MLRGVAQSVGVRAKVMRAVMIEPQQQDAGSAELLGHFQRKHAAISRTGDQIGTDPRHVVANPASRILVPAELLCIRRPEPPSGIRRRQKIGPRSQRIGRSDHADPATAHAVRHRLRHARAGGEDYPC